MDSALQGQVIGQFEKRGKHVVLSVVKKVGLGGPEGEEDRIEALSTGYQRWLDIAELKPLPFEQMQVWVCEHVFTEFGGVDPGQVVWEGFAYLWCCKQGGQAVADRARRKKTNNYGDLDLIADACDEEQGGSLFDHADVVRLKKAAMAIPRECAAVLLKVFDDIPEEKPASPEIRRAVTLFKAALRQDRPEQTPLAWHENLELWRLFDALANGSKVLGAQTGECPEPRPVFEVDQAAKRAMQMDLFGWLTTEDESA